MLAAKLARPGLGEAAQVWRDGPPVDSRKRNFFWRVASDQNEYSPSVKRRWGPLIDPASSGIRPTRLAWQCGRPSIQQQHSTRPRPPASTHQSGCRLRVVSTARSHLRPPPTATTCLEEMRQWPEAQKPGQATLTSFDWQASLAFLDEYERCRTGQRTQDVHPSQKILAVLLGEEDEP